MRSMAADAAPLAALGVFFEDSVTVCPFKRLRVTYLVLGLRHVQGVMTWRGIMTVRNCTDRPETARISAKTG